MQAASEPGSQASSIPGELPAWGTCLGLAPARGQRSAEYVDACGVSQAVCKNLDCFQGQAIAGSGAVAVCRDKAELSEEGLWFEPGTKKQGTPAPIPAPALDASERLGPVAEGRGGPLLLWQRQWGPRSRGLCSGLLAAARGSSLERQAILGQGRGWPLHFAGDGPVVKVQFPLLPQTSAQSLTSAKGGM